MDRIGLALVIVIFLPAATVAQWSVTGMLTPHVGVTHGGDVADPGFTPGASLAVLEASGLGAELDLSHALQFDDSRFAETGITAFMLNVHGAFGENVVRPFIVAGVGLLRVRGLRGDNLDDASRTDWGFNFGGGAFYMLNDAYGIRGDVRYFRYFQQHDDLPVLDTGAFSFWRTSVGVTFSWPIR